MSLRSGAQFHHVVRIVPASGRVIFNGTDAEIAGRWRWAAGAGRRGSAWNMVGIDGRQSVDFGGERFGTVQWNAGRTQSRLNALAAIAAARHVGVAPANRWPRGLRLRASNDAWNCAGGLAASRCMTTLRFLSDGDRRRARSSARSNPAGILAVFEPLEHHETQRDADPSGNTSTVQNVPTPSQVASTGMSRNQPSRWGRAADFEISMNWVRAVVWRGRAGDHILVMSNGGFGGIHDKLLKQLPTLRHALV